MHGCLGLIFYFAMGRLAIAEHSRFRRVSLNPELVESLMKVYDIRVYQSSRRRYYACDSPTQ